MKSHNTQDTADAEKWLQSFSVEQLTEILAQRKLFQDMCSAEGLVSQPPERATSLPWAAFPGACPTLVAHTSAERAVQGEAEPMHKDVYKMEREWQSLHAVLPAAPKSKIPATTSSQCMFGVCVCKRKHQPVGVMKTRAKQFVDNLDSQLVNTGTVVLTWQCCLMDDDQKDKASAGEGVPTKKLVTHLCYCSWRPFRPVFMVLEEVSGDKHCFCPALVETNQPQILTLFEVLHSLDSDACWDVTAQRFCDSHTAVSSLNGRVWVESEQLSLAMRIWHGDAVEWKKGGAGRQKRNAKIYELLAAEMGRAHRKPSRTALDDRDGGAFSEEDGDQSDEPETDKEETEGGGGGGGANCTSDGHGQASAEEEGDDNGFDVAGFLQDAALRRQQRARASPSSSSGSSDSSSTSSPDEQKRDSGGEEQICAPHQSSRSEKVLQRQRQHGSHRWGPHLLTFRKGTPTQKAAWQATCSCSSHTYTDEEQKLKKCTRSRTLPTLGTDHTSDESTEVLQALRSWLMCAGDHATREEHMALGHCRLTDEEIDLALQFFDASSESDAPRKRRRRG
eukprot:6491929-Amphidinium_carterae.1